MRIVFTGPPGSGKTTLLKSPELNVHFEIFPEVARQLIALYPTLSQENLNNLIELNQIKQYDDSERSVRHCIFDRGIPDQLGYRRYFGDEIPQELEQHAEDFRYDKVFYFPYWDDIYKQDAERKEDPAEAKEIGVCLKLSYMLLGYEVIVVPKGTPQERVNFILSKINGSQI